MMVMMIQWNFKNKFTIFKLAIFAMKPKFAFASKICSTLRNAASPIFTWLVRTWVGLTFIAEISSWAITGEISTIRGDTGSAIFTWIRSTWVIFYMEH